MLRQASLSTSTQLIKNFRLQKATINRFHTTTFYANKPVKNEDDYTDDKKDSELVRKKLDELQEHLRRPSKPLKNDPFIKNLFCGIYKYEYLKFPEFENNTVLEDFNRRNLNGVKDFLSNNNNKLVHENGFYKSELLNKLKSLRLFGQSLPQEYTGLSLDSTLNSRLIEEISKYNPQIAMNLIYNNDLAANSIALYGSQDQKNKYLKRIASGELKAAFCVSEPDNGFDSARFNLIATEQTSTNEQDPSEYVLNGRKSWVSLMTNEDVENKDAVFILFAKTINKSNEPEINAFIVDKETPGLDIKRIHSSSNGVNLYELELANVRVKENESLLGNSGAGHDIKNAILDNSRHLVGAICVGMLKNLFKKTVEFTISAKRFDKSICEFSLIKDRLANIETKLYAMESVTYLTAGILDSYETADIGCESALTKIFCTESLKSAINDCIEIMAMSAYSNNISNMQDNLYSNLNYLQNMLYTNDVLRIYVGTSGTILAGIEHGEGINKLRNPLMFPGFAIKQLITSHKIAKSITKQVPDYFYLWEHVHPSLREQSRTLEQISVKLVMATKAALLNSGRDVTENQIEIKYLSDLAMYIYVLNAAIARASRSYSIGLPNSNHEVSLVSLLSMDISYHFNEIYKNIVNSRTGATLQNQKINVADKVIKAGQHAAEHPISRNY